MNWIDFNIICIGARQPKIYTNDLYSIEAMNKNPNKAHKCYVDNWDLVNRIQGIWYELWSINDINSFIINSTWKLHNGNNLYGYQLFIEKKYKDKFLNIFNFYIANSPIRKIIVLFRHQGYESGYIENNMAVGDFLDKLINKEIYANIAYIIGD